MTHSPPTQPLWMAVPLPEFPALDRDIDVDVLVVGAGLTGITTAYLLTQEGVRVALIEREKVASADTGRTTAHLTYVTDERLHHLVSKFGADAARKFWEGGVRRSTPSNRSSRRPAMTPSSCACPDICTHPSVGSRVARRSNRCARMRSWRSHSVSMRPLSKAPCTAACPACASRSRRSFIRVAISKGLLAEIEQQRRADVRKHGVASRSRMASRMIVQANGHKIRCKYLVHRHSQSADGQEGRTDRDGLFQTKLALYTSYVLGRALAARRRAGRAVLGHQRSLRILARRRATTIISTPSSAART